MLIVDRIENNLVVCIDSASGEIFDIPVSAFSQDIKEGVVVKKINNLYEIDYNATENRRKAMRDKLNSLFGK